MKELEKKYIDKIDEHLITSLGKFEHGYVMYANTAKTFITELIFEAMAELEALQAPKTCNGCTHEKQSSPLYIHCFGCNRMKTLSDKYYDKNTPCKE